MANILLFGDSIAWGAYDSKGGWAQRLREYFEKNLHGEKDNTIYNLGISGDNSNGLVERLEFESKLRIDPDSINIIVIAIGINDSQKLIRENKNRTDLETFKINLGKIAEMTRKISEKQIFVGLTPVDETKTMPIAWDNNKQYSNTHIESYDSAVKEVANGVNLPFVDLLSNLKNTDYKNLLADGLHPNEKGHKFIAEKIKKELIKLLSK